LTSDNRSGFFVQPLLLLERVRLAHGDPAALDRFSSEATSISKGKLNLL
jgi:hypothetical protein